MASFSRFLIWEVQQYCMDNFIIANVKIYSKQREQQQRQLDQDDHLKHRNSKALAVATVTSILLEICAPCSLRYSYPLVLLPVKMRIFKLWQMGKSCLTKRAPALWDGFQSCLVISEIILNSFAFRLRHSWLLIKARAASVDILGIMFNRGSYSTALSISALFYQFESKIWSSTQRMFLDDWPKKISLIQIKSVSPFFSRPNTKKCEKGLNKTSLLLPQQEIFQMFLPLSEYMINLVFLELKSAVGSPYELLLNYIHAIILPTAQRPSQPLPKLTHLVTCSQQSGMQLRALNIQCTIHFIYLNFGVSFILLQFEAMSILIMLEFSINPLGEHPVQYDKARQQPYASSQLTPYNCANFCLFALAVVQQIQRYCQVFLLYLFKQLQIDSLSSLEVYFSFMKVQMDFSLKQVGTSLNKNLASQSSSIQEFASLIFY